MGYGRFGEKVVNQNHFFEFRVVISELRIAI